MVSTKRLKLASSSFSAEKIANNDDLLLQILDFLPVKSLLKFKRVSKHWLSLITNPHFCRRDHLSRSPCICGLFLQTYSRGSYQINFIDLNCEHSEALPSVSHPPNTKIMRSCNGLLLCRDIQSYQSMYSVCNPTTGQCTALPPLGQTKEISWCVSLAFDPLTSTEYKVICLVEEETEEPEFRIVIYSSKSRNWRASEARICLDFDIGINGGVYWNGGIHWDTDSGPCFYFDLDEEQIKEMLMPNPIPDYCGRRRVRYFGESRGHLQLIEIYHPPSKQFDVWELKRDYSGWLLKYKVDLDALVREYPGMFRDYIDIDFDSLNAFRYVFAILFIVDSEREEKSFMMLHIPGNIIRYDFKTRIVKKICDFPKNETADNFYSSSGYQYIESLARL